MRSQRIPAIAISILGTLTVLAAQGPDGIDPVAILERANRAHKAARWLEYDFEYAGTFGARGRVTGDATVVPAAAMPALEFAADVRLPLAPNNLVSYPTASHLALVDGMAFRLDAGRRHADTATVAKGGLVLIRPLTTFVPPQFMRDEPLGVEITQPEQHIYAGRADVGGVECDVIYLQFPAASGLGEQYFYLGVQDHLLRRIVFNAPGANGMPPFAWDLTLRNVRAGSGAPPRALRPEMSAGWTVEDHDAVAAGVGDVAPDWSLERRGGGRVYSASLRGQVVVLDFWASWCPFCRRNTPGLGALRHEMRGQPVRVFAVQVWDDEDPGPALAQAGVSLEMLLDGDAVAEQLKVGGTPTAVVIGRDGRIVARVGGSGERREQQLRAAIAAALATPLMK